MKPIERWVRIKVTDHEATGQAMRARRKKRGLTLQQVAERAGISVSFLSALECGNRVWTQHWCDVIDAALAGYYQKLPEGTK